MTVSVTDIWMQSALAGRECITQEQLKTEVAAFLKGTHFDGLSNGADCGCTLANLGHCGRMRDGCRVGRFLNCSDCILCRDNGEDRRWLVGDCIDSTGCVNVVTLLDDASDPSAPADFAAVGAAVKAERDVDRLADARQKEVEG